MSSFSREWLRLREPADRSARNSEIANAVAARFALRSSISVVDLGCGTGTNLRATCGLLPGEQWWRLVDSDSALLDAARDELSAWADHVENSGTELHLRKGSTQLHVTFQCLDLSQDLDAALDSSPALVTASALFDLTSAEFVRDLARRCTTINAAFYTVLTYNGIQRWTPHRPADNQIASAFHNHQMRDKGFGPALGPTAPAHLADQFRLNGYSVLEGDSPWVLDRSDRMLVDELVRGHAVAAGETKMVDTKTLEGWVKVQRHGAVIGHTDTFAAPA
jgi:SAM-dependent methyltransferase